MKERPVLFSTEMVKAILGGRKTQTRRIIKPQPTEAGLEFATACGGEFYAWQDGGLNLDEYSEDGGGCQRLCPYGRVGDRLWVRETWAHPIVGGTISNITKNKNAIVRYEADGSFNNFQGEYYDTWYKRPSIHMPRWASRITLEITEVRGERVQEITAYDALLEGIGLPIPKGCEIPAPPPEYEGWSEERRERWIKGQARATYFSRCADAQDHIDAFQKLWDSLNAKRGYGWEANCFVWVLTFRKV